MSVNNVNTYVDYFRQLAVRHKNLLHNPAAESGDSTMGASHFTKWNLNELVSGLRTKVGWPAMMLELYETQTAAQIQYDIKQRPKGAFTILQHVKEGDVFAEEAAYALTETILYDILKQIWQDHYAPGVDRCKTPFYQFVFDNLDIASTGKILTNEMGWRVEFSFEFQRAIDITKKPEDGTFINPAVQALGYDNNALDADDLLNAQ